MAQIPSTLIAFDKNFGNVVDNRFKQLSNTSGTNLPSDITVDEFFEIYEEIFYQIPKEGDSNSHTYILNRTTEYLGVKVTDDIDVAALLEEITSLRQELLDANRTLNNINE